jgi:hypothetical protein
MTNNLIIAKIKCIQAEADATKMMADTGAASKGYNDAMEEVCRLDDQVKIAKEKALELITAARKYLVESGKDEDETKIFIQVVLLLTLLRIGSKSTWYSGRT